MEDKIGVTVRDALRQKSLAGARVLAGEQGLDRSVTSVNVMEVPDIVDWVSPGELIITTAYPFKNDVTALYELVEKLNAAEVSGLGIKSKRYIGQVPQDVIELADKLCFPIFEIPYSTTFSEVIAQILTGILNHKTFVLGQIQDLNHSLTQVMLSGGDQQEISRILYQKFGNSVSIISDYLSSFVCNTTPDRQSQIVKIVENENATRFFKESMTVDAMKPFRVSDGLDGSPCMRIVIPICNENTLYGKIYMWEDFRKISAVEQSAIESSASLIALDMIKKLSILEIENNNRLDFLDNLLSGDRRQCQKALLSAKLFGYDPGAAHQVVTLRLKQPQDGETLSKKALYHLNTNVIAILQGLMKNGPSKIIYASRGSNQVLLHQMPSDREGDCEKKTNGLIDSLCRRLTTEKLESYVAIGVGRSYSQSSDLYKSFQEAKRAAISPAPLRGPTDKSAAGCRAVYYSEIGIYRLLTFDSIRSEAELFCEEMLGPLLAYDEAKDAQLLKTLRVYYQCRGNLTKLSRMLKVHYNTVLYRLEKVKTILGIDLEAEEDLLNLQIALKLYEMKDRD